MAEGRLIRVPAWFASPTTKYPDVSAALLNPHNSIKNAEAYAASLAVSAHYGMHLDIGNMVNEVLTQMKARNLPLFSAVLVHTDFFREFGEEANDIAARTDYNALFINPDGITWRNPDKVAASLHDAGFWSTPHPLHALYHEAGHLFLPQVGEPRKLLPRQVTIADAVSTRAKKNVEEFVLEVFAGLMVEVEYDADIVGLYKRLGGKLP